MIALEDKCVDGVERRGRVYYMRFRVPSRFAGIERLKEINRSLHTRDHDEARARFAVAKRKLINEWDAALTLGRASNSTEAFEAAIHMMKETGHSYRTMDQLLEGPLDDLLARIEAVGNTASASARIPVFLGAVERPPLLLSEMPGVLEGLEASTVYSKNARQLRTWRNKYKRAAALYETVCRDKVVFEITEEDALACKRHLTERCERGEITVEYAAKHIQYLGQLVDAYFEKFDIPTTQQFNPFHMVKISKKIQAKRGEAKKIALPASWVKEHIIDQKGLDGLNDEAKAIAIITAESGARQSEIYDVAPSDIFLEAEVPHMRIRMVEEGDDKRQIKNEASERLIVLQGAAFEAMRKHPEGFPRYRGKGSYSATVNNYIKDRGLFPEAPDGQKYTIGCTRHTYEDRMVAANMTNEERAFMMGHSIGSVRGRPVYGSKPELQVRALLQEMVAFPTDTWQPRSHKRLRREIARISEAHGFRIG